MTKLTIENDPHLLMKEIFLERRKFTIQIYDFRNKIVQKVSITIVFYKGSPPPIILESIYQDSLFWSYPRCIHHFVILLLIYSFTMISFLVTESINSVECILLKKGCDLFAQ